jgi:hypothetical protein
MRELRLLHRRCVALRRQAGAAVVLASLLALFLSQPFHASLPRYPAAGNAAHATAVAITGPSSSHAAGHDADFCSMCRATAQTRLGLRLALRLGEVAATRPCLALHLPAAAPVQAAPSLRLAQPRAPPSALPLISA